MISRENHFNCLSFSSIREIRVSQRPSRWTRDLGIILGIEFLSSLSLSLNNAIYNWKFLLFTGNLSDDK